ncbi:MAG: hypothetical protein AAGI27_02525 [Pseudomonadota bacterium]
MLYLTVDGELSGTGIRDSVNGGYLHPEELGLHERTQKRMSAWVNRYEHAHYSGFSDQNLVNQLDEEGLAICGLVRAELSEVKVEYYSHARGERLLIHK